MSLLIQLGAVTGSKKARAETGLIPVPPIVSAPTLSIPETVRGDFSRPPAAVTTTVSSVPPSYPASPLPVPAGYVPGLSTERIAQRRVDAKVFANPDGTKTARVYSSPTHYRGTDGTWKDIDTRVLPDAGGFHNAGGLSDIHFASAANSSDLISVEVSNTRISFAMEGAGQVPGVANGSEVRYLAVTPGADLEYRVGKTLVKETVILHQPPQAGGAVFRFPLALTGLTPSSESNGGIGFYDGANAQRFFIPPPIMWDSNRDPNSDEPVYGPASMSLTQEGSTWVITLSGDMSWLSSSARVYPVYLDPTLYFGAQDSGSGFDTFVSSASPNQNYNVSCCGGVPGHYQDKIGYYNSSTGTNWSYLSYDLGFLNGRTINSAAWNGYFIHSYQATTETLYRMQPVSSGWAAGTLTWNNKPGLMGNYIDGMAVRHEWRSSDLTGWVQNWTNGTWVNNGIAIHTAGQGQTSWKKLAANEDSDGYASYVEVDYNTPPAMASAISPANGAASYSIGLTPTLSVSGSDPDGDNVDYYFLVCTNLAMSECIWSSELTSSSSVTIPAGILKWNTTYYWNAYTGDGSQITNPNWVRSFTATNAAPAAAQADPPNDWISTTTTPTLNVNPSTDPEGTSVHYFFRVATGSDGQSGLTVDSGWVTSTAWAPPEGSLTDGGSYYWTVSARDDDWVQSWSAARSLKVDLGLGDRSSRPYDRFGSVAVNLGNGNAVITASSPSFNTLGGSIGFSYNYNSQSPSNAGLVGSYFNDDGNRTFDPYETPSVARTDPQVDFNWGSGSPYGSINADRFLVRWTGYVTVPATGVYSFGRISDDGARIWVDNNLVLDQWTDQSASENPQYATSTSLAAGQTTSIKAEYYENSGSAAMQLWVKGPIGEGGAQSEAPVPASWLSTNIAALPDGWSLSTSPDGDLAYTSAQIADKSVVLFDSTGAIHPYRWTGSAWAPPADEDGVLTNDASTGLLALAAEDGRTYHFNADGTLASVSSSIDDRNPSAPVYLWTGTPSRLTRITDPVSGRYVTLTYNLPGNLPGSTDCPMEAGFTSAPSYMLCKIDFSQFGGGETHYYYSNGHLARILNPGNEVTDFGYGSDGLLNQLRDPLTNDLISAGIFSDPASDAHKTLIEYESGRAVGATAPVPDASGSARPQHSYQYLAGSTNVSITGLNQPLGYARKVTVDTAGRLIEDKDVAGKVTTFTYDSADHLTSTTDPTQMKTTTTYDAVGHPTEVRGPWLASNFAGAPVSKTFYDENINGLAAAWWNNTGMVGAPRIHTTFGAWVDWASGSPNALVSTDGFSGRLSGEISLPSNGTYTFTADVGTDDGVRLFVDDKLIVDRWTAGVGQLSGTAANQTAGAHRVRIDYKDPSGGAKLIVSWTPPGGSSAQVPFANLKPRYGLATSKIDPDNRKAATEYATPELGLPTASIKDPAGLNLRSTTIYETAGSGYFRRVMGSPPRGDTAHSSYSYFGPSETADNPCTSEVEAINQAGALKTSIAADPAGALPNTALSGGANHTLALKSDGTVLTWGLGNLAPTQVPGLTGVTAIAAGMSHSLALKSDGTVWTWYTSAPVQVVGLTNVIAISAYGHSFAIKSDGTVWGWGGNLSGQLGDGTTTNRPVPVQISALTGVIAIAAGSSHSLALKSDGTVLAWGKNEYGQVGDGTTNNVRTTPVQVSGLTGMTAIAAGPWHSLALKSDGTVRAWGNNNGGSLGDGTTINRSTPVQVSSLSGVTAIAAGFTYSLALKSDRTVRSWGSNLYGRLGNSSESPWSYTPVTVTGLTDVTGIDAGEDHGLALKTDGTAWAWGGNDLGQLGDGTTDYYRRYPIQASLPSAPTVINEFRYDQAGRLMATRVVTDPQWTCTTYDSRGRVTSQRDSAGRTTSIDHSTPAVVVTTFTDSSGAARTTRSETDWLGRPTKYADENGTITRTTYDQSGRATATYRQFNGQSEAQLTALSYNPATSRLASITEYASGAPRTTSFSYDDAGKLVSTTRPNGVVTTNGYDANAGALSSISNKKGVTELSPWSYIRSASGNVTSETTTGRTRTFTFDNAGRLTRTVEGAVTRNYSFDLNSNRCSTTTTCNGSYVYDYADRITSSPFATGYVYDPHGNLVSATPTRAPYSPSSSFSGSLPDGLTQSHQIVATAAGTISANLNWQPTIATDTVSSVVSIVAQEDRPITVSANGVVSATLTWPSSLLSNLDLYLLDQSGVEVASSTQVTGNSESVTFTVSGLGPYPASRIYTLRVKSVGVGSTYALTYSHPATANLDLELWNPSGAKVAEAISTTARPETLSYSVPSTATGTYTLKAVSKDHAASYSLSSTYPRGAKLQIAHDGGDHAVSTDDGVNKIEETLAPSGRVLRRVVKDSVTSEVSEDTTFGYADGSDSPSYSKPIAGGAITTYINGPGGLLVIDTQGTHTYPIQNGHGDIVGTTDANGVYAANPVTDEFGVGTPPPNRLGWLGGKERFSTGGNLNLIRMGVRLYDPALGRFLSRDPVEGGSLNDYEYGNGDCVNNYDLDGRAVNGWLNRYNKCQATYKAQNDFYKSLSFDVAGVMEDLLSFKIPVGRGRGWKSFVTRQGAIRLLKNVAVRSAARPARWASRGIAFNLGVTAFGFGAQGGQAMYCEARAFQGRTS